MTIQEFNTHYPLIFKDIIKIFEKYLNYEFINFQKFNLLNY